MAQVGLPLTGAGDATAQVATDQIGTEHWQRMKLGDGEEGSTVMGRILATTPGTTDAGVVTRPIPSSAYNQAVVGEVALTSVGSTRLVGQVTLANPTTAVSLSSAIGITSGSSAVELTSAGSTRLAGRFTVENPTTAFSLSSQHTVTADLSIAGSTRSVGTLNQGSPAGTSADAWWVRSVTTGSAGGSTTVDANLTSAGSTKVIGTVGLSSGAVLGGSTAAIGVIAQGTPGGSSADAWWVRTVTTGAAGAGSTTVDANLTSAGSTRIVGLVDGVPFTSAGIARTSFASSVDFAIFAGNAARRALMIANNSTATVLLVSLNSTVAVTSAGPYNFQVPALGTLVMGGQVGNMPNFTGLARAKLNSTAVAGTVFVTEYT